MSREQAVRARVREIISTARVRLADEVIACRASGPDGTDEELRAAMDEALAAGDWKPRPLYDIPVAPWRAVPGGAIKKEGNLIHLRIDPGTKPWTGEDSGAEDVGAPEAEPMQEPRRDALGTLDLGRRLATMDFDPIWNSRRHRGWRRACCRARA